MGVFADWVRRKHVTEETGLGQQTGSIDHELDEPVDYEKVKRELFTVVLTKYPDETFRFLEEIGDRGDEEVRTLLRKLRRQKTGGGGFTHKHDPDQVVPCIADTGHGAMGSP